MRISYRLHFLRVSTLPLNYWPNNEKQTHVNTTFYGKCTERHVWMASNPASFWEVLSSNLCLEIGYPKRGLLWFFSVPPGKCLNKTLNETTTCSFHILSNSSFTYHPFIRLYMMMITSTGETSSLKCCQQGSYCSSHRSYMSMEDDSGWCRLGKTPDSSNRALSGNPISRSI
jgi:hypothetical protein